MSIPALSVSQLNLYIKYLLEQDEHLRAVCVRGEISNFTNHTKSGHYYFTLKDENAIVKAVMFRWQNEKLRFVPETGMHVIVYGKVSLFERDGQYQIYVEQMTPDGLGACYLAFRQLKEKLEQEGLFDPSRKRPLPESPRSIGLCTSADGAALRDIVSVAKRRNPLVRLVLFPCNVQGKEAVPSVLKGLHYFNTVQNVDLIIVARGGGSYEDLAVFNDEGFARAVAASPLPVISAIGHEVDYTIADYAADMRAATPSVAAEIAVPDLYTLTQQRTERLHRIGYALENRIETDMLRLDRLTLQLQPEQMIGKCTAHLEYLVSRIGPAMEHLLIGSERQLGSYADRLCALNPLAVLGRGYSVVQNESGTVLNSIMQISQGEALQILMKDGVVDCHAESKRAEDL